MLLNDGRSFLVDRHVLFYLDLYCLHEEEEPFFLILFSLYLFAFSSIDIRYPFLQPWSDVVHSWQIKDLLPSWPSPSFILGCINITYIQQPSYDREALYALLCQVLFPFTIQQTALLKSRLFMWIYDDDGSMTQARFGRHWHTVRGRLPLNMALCTLAIEEELYYQKDKTNSFHCCAHFSALKDEKARWHGRCVPFFFLFFKLKIKGNLFANLSTNGDDKHSVHANEATALRLRGGQVIC